MTKCQRCGNKAIIRDGGELREASGPDAIVALTIRGIIGTIQAEVCGDCATMLKALGWS